MMRNLQNDMQDMKMNNADETEESGKETRMDSSDVTVATVPPSGSTMGGGGEWWLTKLLVLRLAKRI